MKKLATKKGFKYWHKDGLHVIAQGSTGRSFKTALKCKEYLEAQNGIS